MRHAEYYPNPMSFFLSLSLIHRREQREKQAMSGLLRLVLEGEEESQP